MNALVLIVFLGGGVVGIPKPDLKSVEAVTPEICLGEHTNYDVTSIFLGLSLLEIRFYWGKPFAALAGCELANVHTSYGAEWHDAGGLYYREFVTPTTCELINPQIGIALIGKPMKPLLSPCCAYNGTPIGNFAPRIELSTGLTSVNFNFYGDENTVTCLTWRNELRLHPFSLEVRISCKTRLQPRYHRP